MSLESWALVAQIVASVGVILSLIYLAVQVRQGNKTQRIQARQSWMENVQNELQMMVDHPGIFRAFAAEKPSEEDKIRFIHWMFSFLRAREYEWKLYKDGVMDEAHYESYAAAIHLGLGTTRSRDFWERYKRFYDSDFVRVVDAKIRDAPLLDDVHFRDVMSVWADQDPG